MTAELPVPVPPTRGSIRWRATVLTSALVAVVLTTFIWFVGRQAQDDLARSGADRAETIASLLANQSAQSTDSALRKLTDQGTDPRPAAYLTRASVATEEAALAWLHELSLPNQEQALELWDAAGHRRLRLVLPSSAAQVVPEEATLPPVGIGPLEAHENQIFSQTAVPVVPPGGTTPIGRVVVRRRVRSTPSSSVSDIVGSGAIVLVGNQSGSLWTDLSQPVPTPQFDVAVKGAREFLGPSGERFIGASASIPGTPYVVLIELRRSVVVAPAGRLLRQLITGGVAFLLVTMLVASVLSAQVSRPLAELTEAAKALARGNYARRVPAGRRDEIGQLSETFNVMAARIEQARTDLEAHAADLEAAREAADRATRVKDEFLAALSHELRTPLNSMLGWCQMLRTGAVPAEKTAHAVNVIERNALAQLRLVEDLLDVSRIVAGKFTLETQVVDAALVVSAAVESIHPIAAARQITLAADISPETGSVQGDPGRLQQAVWNLLSNAIKFTPRGGRVDITVHRTGTEIEILVVDNGAGISSEALPVIFDRLAQGHREGARRHGGLGLGLAIVRQVIELHHGTVEAESHGLGYGSTFRIRLPAWRAAAAEPERFPLRLVRGGAARAAVPSARDLDILVVEDAEDARQLLEDFLTGQRARVTAVPSAEAALVWLDSHRPDVIISDIEMPVQNGLELMRRIRLRTAADVTPAIALTAYGGADDRERTRTSGFQAHLTKPVDLNELLDTIAALSTRRSSAAAVVQSAG